MGAKLIKTKDLAAQLGLPHDAMVDVASKHGLIIKCGRTKSIKEDEIGELIEACREKPKQHVCFSATEKVDRQSTSSKTTATKSLQALATLKKRKSI